MGKKGRGRGRGADTRPSSAARIAVCGLFCDNTPKALVTKQKNCCPCHNDIMAMRRDAKAAGKAAVTYLKQKDAKAASGKDKPGLHKMHDDWQAEAGDVGVSCVRCGVFDWAQYMVRYSASSGMSKMQDKVMKMETEFIDLMEKKGMSRTWAAAEFKKRWSSPAFKQDHDPDCKKPRVSMHRETTDRDWSKRGKSHELQHGGKQLKTPSTEALTEMMEDVALHVPHELSSAHSDALRGDASSLASMLEGSTVAQTADWWEHRDGGGDEATELEEDQEAWQENDQAAQALETSTPKKRKHPGSSPAGSSASPSAQQGTPTATKLHRVTGDAGNGKGSERGKTEATNAAKAWRMRRLLRRKRRRRTIRRMRPLCLQHCPRSACRLGAISRRRSRMPRSK